MELRGIVIEKLKSLYCSSLVTLELLKTLACFGNQAFFFMSRMHL